MKLEKFNEDDKALYCRVVLNREAMEMNLGRPFTAGEADVFFPMVLEQNASHPLLGFYKAFVRANGKYEFAGMCALLDNEEFGAPEIEYVLLPEYWGRGYGTAAARKLLETAETLEAHKSVIAITDPGNVRSKRILEKLGFAFVKRYINCDGEPAELYKKPLHAEDDPAE